MDREKRINQLRDLLKAEPNDLFLNYALGIEFIHIPGALAQAEEQFNKVLGLDPDYIAVYYQLGKLKEMTGNNAEAIAYFKSGLEIARNKKDNKAVNEFGEAIFLLED
jgi:tetratricopeptide (TPR) repeat protein